jgi:hypothetical protein
MRLDKIQPHAREVVRKMVSPATGAAAADEKQTPYVGSRFRDVRAQLLSDPYTVLPIRKVSFLSMFKMGKNLLMQDAISLIDKDADLVPPMDKLLHRVGICFFGRWTITEETPYTGCFRTGVQYLIVVRCSTLLSHTDRGDRRGFGFAGKIFPTLDPDEVVKTANFITIDDLGGTLAPRYTDVALTNQPPFGLNFSMLSLFFSLANVVYVFQRTDSVPDYRPLYELSETGLRQGETPLGPKWLQISATPGIGKYDAIDFRDELRVDNYKDSKLSFDISVATEEVSKQRQWKRIGNIVLNEHVCSESGDHRIRFRHLPNRGHAIPS